jgi:hypothetical protein
VPDPLPRQSASGEERVAKWFRHSPFRLPLSAFPSPSLGRPVFNKHSGRGDSACLELIGGSGSRPTFLVSRPFTVLLARAQRRVLAHTKNHFLPTRIVECAVLWILPNSHRKPRDTVLNAYLTTK